MVGKSRITSVTGLVEPGSCSTLTHTPKYINTYLNTHILQHYAYSEVGRLREKFGLSAELIMFQSDQDICKAQLVYMNTHKHTKSTHIHTQTYLQKAIDRANTFNLRQVIHENGLGRAIRVRGFSYIYCLCSYGASIFICIWQKVNVSQKIVTCST